MPDEHAGTEDEWRRRKKQAADRLGDLLPESAQDESAQAWGDRDERTRDDDLLRDVPPHHG